MVHNVAEYNELLLYSLLSADFESNVWFKKNLWFSHATLFNTYLLIVKYLGDRALLGDFQETYKNS